jgi:hypothetical protein
MNIFRRCIAILLTASLTASLAVPALAQETAPVPVDPTPVVTGVSTDFIAIPSKQPFHKYITIEGTNLDHLIFNPVVITFGTAIAEEVIGNDTAVRLSFTLNPADYVYRDTYPIDIYENGQLLLRVQPFIYVSNPLFHPYEKQKTRRFLSNTDNTKSTKRTIGLNYHWGLGADADDLNLYENALSDSRTRWVREFIDYDVIMGENQAGWFERYDKAMLEYKEKDVRVVAMLAYGTETNGRDRYAPPSEKEWRQFVRTVVKRYRNQVDAWEIWNEPDSPDYMHPNTVNALHPLLKSSYGLIKQYDPDSVVLNGPIANIKHTKFVKNLYKKSGKYFDELSIHLYYCDEYMQYGDNSKLHEDVERLTAAIPKERRNQKMWITEFGCSLAVPGVSEKKQQSYLKRTSKELLKTGRFHTILLYDLRDRPFMDPYEAQFGLLTAEGQPKPSWEWYHSIPKKYRKKP